MGETSDQIERHIQETRHALSDNVNELEVRVKTALDWRAQFEEHPGRLLAVAFGGGALLSMLLPSARSRRSFVGRWGTAADGNVTRARQTWDALKGALIGVATARLSGFVEELLPGFNQEFTKAQGGNGYRRRRHELNSSAPISSAAGT
jgi:hypothetical protein